MARLWTLLIPLAAVQALGTGGAYAAAAPAGGPPAGAGTIAMDEPKDYPRAGVTLALPKGFELRAPSSPWDIVDAAVMENGHPARAVTFSAFSMAAGGTIEDFAEGQMAELKKNLAIRNLKLMRKTDMTVAGIKGAARLLSYTFRGISTMAAQAYFLREVAGTKISVCYLLTVVCTADSQGKLLPILGEVVKSVQLTKVQHPDLQAATAKLDKAVESPKVGVAVRPPAGWYATSFPAGVSMCQVDYLIHNMALPSMNLMVGLATADAATSEACSKRNLAIAKSTATEHKQTAKVLSDEACKLGKLPAWQFVLMESSVAAATDDGKHTSLVLVNRTACGPADGAPAPKVYVLFLTARAEDAKAAVALMDAVAAGFETIQVTTQPATAPTSGPASGPATAPAAKPAAAASQPASRPAAAPAKSAASPEAPRPAME